MPANPYKRVQAATETPRETELRILRTVTYALRRAKEDGDHAGLVRAATNNYLIWQAFLHDVISDGNKLPRDLRRSIAIVSKAIIREIDANLNGNLDVDFLVSMNENVIEGLAAGLKSGA